MFQWQSWDWLSLTGQVGKFLDPKVFCRKFFLTQNFYELNIFEPKFCWTKNYFWPKNFFWLLFLDLKFFWTQNFVGPKIILVLTLFRPMIFLELKFFWTQHFFKPKILLVQTLFFNQKSVWPQNALEIGAGPTCFVFVVFYIIFVVICVVAFILIVVVVVVNVGPNLNFKFS